RAVRCTGAQGLAVAELDEPPVGVTDTAVVSRGVGFVARCPNEASGPLGTVCESIDAGSIVDGKSEVAIVVFRLGGTVAPGEEHEDELTLSPPFGHPCDARLIARVDHGEIAEVAVEGDRGRHVADLQSD